jgi:hypothetical protein
MTKKKFIITLIAVNLAIAGLFSALAYFTYSYLNRSAGSVQGDFDEEVQDSGLRTDSLVLDLRPGTEDTLIAQQQDSEVELLRYRSLPEPEVIDSFSLANFNIPLAAQISANKQGDLFYINSGEIEDELVWTNSEGSKQVVYSTGKSLRSLASGDDVVYFLLNSRGKSSLFRLNYQQGNSSRLAQLDTADSLYITAVEEESIWITNLSGTGCYQYTNESEQLNSKPCQLLDNSSQQVQEFTLVRQEILDSDEDNNETVTPESFPEDDSVEEYNFIEYVYFKDNYELYNQLEDELRLIRLRIRNASENGLSERERSALRVEEQQKTEILADIAVEPVYTGEENEDLTPIYEQSTARGELQLYLLSSRSYRSSDNLLRIDVKLGSGQRYEGDAYVRALESDAEILKLPQHSFTDYLGYSSTRNTLFFDLETVIAEEITLSRLYAYDTGRGMLTQYQLPDCSLETEICNITYLQ